ncbi:(Fe-S)-binding protein|uniref:Glycolate oxidase iron-sulfur subunit n=1 Tax=Dendrosporobacter quercicolus TaxID=146817 RepID=A0A1G9VR68_9FIRM|nr:(Fe-S)-binding protein [Dendrosporobacter quercicolus]NSL47824.1 (Fe-S)-binding protein [Dendrosporobacter quercicolus DSM 1736]SDM74679.1 glycolate oxidase iron-sulfur subunit [Dendrosporobacter quercicolus]
MENSLKKNNYLQAVQTIVSQCDRCGSCLTVCPLYEARDIESSSARGKNNIARGILAGVIKPDREAQKSVDFCLLCRTCIEHCPNKVKTDDAMIAVRQFLADRNGTPGFKYKVLGGLMKNRRLVKLSAGMLTVIRRLGLSPIVPYGMAPREFTRRQYLAAFAGPAALGSLPAAAPAVITGRSRVAYFKGCGMQLMFPDAVQESIQILRTVTEPQFVDNLCCGLPQLAHGLRADFLAMAKENIIRFAQADVIVGDCASCSGTLKHIAAYLADDPEWAERAAAFSSKVMGLSEYLFQAGYQPRNQSKGKITFHEPCHLGRGQGIKNQPRELLKAAGNFVEMAAANSCCGGAGSFHVDYPEIAGDILGKKQRSIEASGAQIVVSECPTCLVQLNKAALNSGGKFRAMHISQVL